MKKGNQVFWGIFWILAAVLLIVWQFTPLATLGVFTVLACMLALAAVVQGIISRNIFSITLPLAILYIILQYSLEVLPFISPWILIVAAVIISLGFSMIFKIKPTSCDYSYHHSGGARPQMQYNVGDDNNNPKIAVSFGSQSRYLQANPLQGGQFSASFGSLEIYFDQVTLPPAGADISLECSFGSIELFVPRGWRLEDHLAVALANVETHGYQAQLAPDAPVLRLYGNVSFGNIEVRYI